MELSSIIPIISWLLIAIGFIGCFIHKFPGPVTAFIGMLIFIFGMKVNPIPWVGIVICVILLVITAVANKKFIPLIAKQISEFGKGGKWGAIIGSILGLIIIVFSFMGTAAAEESKNGLLILLLIIGFGVIPFVAALIGETVSRKNMSQALKPATAAYLTYLLSMILKLIVCVYCVYIILTDGHQVQTLLAW